MSARKWFTVTITLLLVVSVAACAPAATATPTPTGVGTSIPATGATQAPSAAPTTVSAGGAPVVINFWHGQSQSQQTALNALVAQFNATHPGIKVVATYQGTYSDLYNKVTAAVAAGSPPDLAIAYQNDVANYIKDGAVIPLNSLMSDPQIGFSSADLQDIYPAFIDHYPQFGNQVYSIAFMRSMEVMYYNMDLLKAAGFNQPPTTWTEFMNMCAAVSKPPTTYCYEMNTDASRFSNWLWSRGGSLLSPDGKTVAFNSLEGLATMNFINDLFTKKEAIVIGKAFQDQTDFSLGKIAFTFGSTAGLPFYQQSIQQAGVVKDWGIAPDPHSTPNPVVDLYGPSVTIFKTTTQRERDAFVFLKYLMGTQADSAWVEATSYFPARQSTRSSLTSFIQANPLYGQALGWVQYGKTEPTIAAWNPIRGYIADAMTAVANGKETPSQALNDAASKANQAIASQ
ncbi:MAG: ABC transporter substrate-binding protein [Chloroflexi bacterium]|nr:ABC transporter substrate-binding protein [Chloroflexota bacterium]